MSDEDFLMAEEVSFSSSEDQEERGGVSRAYSMDYQERQGRQTRIFQNRETGGLGYMTVSDEDEDDDSESDNNQAGPSENGSWTGLMPVPTPSTHQRMIDKLNRADVDDCDQLVSVFGLSSSLSFVDNVCYVRSVGDNPMYADEEKVVEKFLIKNDFWFREASEANREQVLQAIRLAISSSNSTQKCRWNGGYKEMAGRLVVERMQVMAPAYSFEQCCVCRSIKTIRLPEWRWKAHRVSWPKGRNHVSVINLKCGSKTQPHIMCMPCFTEWFGSFANDPSTTADFLCPLCREPVRAPLTHRLSPYCSDLWRSVDDEIEKVDNFSDCLVQLKSRPKKRRC